MATIKAIYNRLGFLQFFATIFVVECDSDDIVRYSKWILPTMSFLSTNEPMFFRDEVTAQRLGESDGYKIPIYRIVKYSSFFNLLANLLIYFVIVLTIAFLMMTIAFLIESYSQGYCNRIFVSAHTHLVHTDLRLAERHA